VSDVHPPGLFMGDEQGAKVKLEVWSMTCEHCGEDMRPIFVHEGTERQFLSRWTCNYCGVSEPPEAVERRAFAGQCEVCDE